jgi:hypothetical protein
VSQADGQCGYGLAATTLIAKNHWIMGEMAISRRLELGGWVAAAAVWPVAGVFLLS